MANAAAAKPSGVNTYHCICSNLVLATTLQLSQLSRRANPALDNALILPCPRVPTALLSAGTSEAQSVSENDEMESDRMQGNMTLLVSLHLAPQATLIRRTDGIEKRYLLHCGRCKLVVAYQLDWAQFPEVENSAKAMTGRRDDIVYLLPGAIMTTKEMRNGTKMKEEDLRFGMADV